LALDSELARLRDDDLNGDRQQKDDNDRLQQLVQQLTRIVSKGALVRLGDGFDPPSFLYGV
jgi:hypothetical protein